MSDSNPDSDPAQEVATAERWSQRRGLSMPASAVWDLMWRPEGLRHWLAPSGHFRLRRDERCELSDDAGTWRIARVVGIRTGAEVTLEVDPAAAWSARTATTVVIAVAPDGEDYCRVSVEESPVGADDRGDVERYWKRRLDCLAGAISEIQKRRKNARQALVVIHGIGEQQPGETLSHLASSGVLSDIGEKMWVKPDRVSGSYELRRIALAGTDTRPLTEVFEFYWAHIIRDTTLGQIAAWLRGLLLRKRVPTALKPLWVFAWVAILIVTSGLVAWRWGLGEEWLSGGTIAVIGLALARLVWKLLGNPLIVEVLGDAARYLTPHPYNVAHRQAIREAGVNLIENLHNSGRYDRIVILGHSLGSVIAYDIITHAWAAMHQKHRRPSNPSFRDIIAVERNLDLADPEAAQKIQAAAWRQQRANTQPWLVSDLVTVGSPLTYADFLMAASVDAFEQAIADRTLPTCPPQDEIEDKSKHRRVSFELPYLDVHTKKDRTFTLLNHGAPFAVTRWTNLYFKVRFLGLGGDVVGGPVAPQFGKWVLDVALPSPAFGFVHTYYWRPSKRTGAHLAELRKALHLDSRSELRELMKAVPAFASLDEPEDDEE